MLLNRAPPHIWPRQMQLTLDLIRNEMLGNPRVKESHVHAGFCTNIA